MNAILEKSTDTPFFAGNAGNIGNESQEPSNGKGLSDVTLFPNPLLVAGNTREQDEEFIVSPIPDDAPPIPSRFKTYSVDGKIVRASADWEYLDARRKVLAHVIRFDGGEGKKQFRPLTLWNTGKGLEWRGKAPIDPRPLYGLDRLAAMPDADVMVCEGEKATDAAARLFPEMVTVTSMNGSQSPNKSDWSPLAGRSVVLWPDNDQPGAEYVATVERLATEAGATVKQVIRLDWFRQVSNEVGIERDELPKGWDAADALAEGFTAEIIQALVDRETADQGGSTLFMPAPSQQVALEKTTSGNADAVPDKAEDSEQKRTQSSDLFKDSEFAVIEFTKGYRNGVYWQEPCGQDDAPKSPLLLCDPLIVAAETRDAEQSNWGRLLTWQDKDSHSHDWACPAELLAASDTSEFRRELMRNGLYVATSGKARQKLVDYVLTQRPLSPERVRCVTKTGWHNGRYVLSNRVFGKSDGEGVIYQGATSGDFVSAGELAEWKREVAGRAVGNSRMVFAIACSFAGTLVDMANESGGGFQFTDETSKGKTSTLIDPAASVWGHPERFAKKWRTTTNGIEALCLSRNDSILILDDLGQSDAKDCGQAAYLIANGQGKARMLKDGGNRPLTTWKTLLLSSGEIDLSQHMNEAGKTARGGQVARLPSIPADAGAGMYVLENLHDQADGRQFADTMKAVSRQFYGTAGTAFMEKLTDPDMLKEITGSIREGITAIVKQMRVPEGAAPEVGRVAARFALVAFAGELATRLGVTGWTQGDAFKAALRCFNDWLNESGGAMGADEKALFAQVAAFLQAHGASRFPPHDIEEDALRKVLNRAGFSYAGSEGVSYWAETGAFSKELCKGFNATSAAKSLIKMRWLEPGKDRTQQKKRIAALGGSTFNFYCLTPLAAGAEK